MFTITCTRCGKEVKRAKPADYDDNSLFVCEECWLKENAEGIEKEKRINEKLVNLVAKGKSYILADIVKEVEMEMSS